jgi:DNA-binding winged helix-turn-helix (wHTH) protein
MSGVDRKIFRFGIFEVDPGSGELRKAGSRLRLQGQPFQVLLMLLERPGDVITREEIRAKLWPSDTFVDFDHSLNTIINKIRDVLSDSAANPRFVETLAKRGYRFLVPVDSVAGRSGGGGEGAAVADSFLSSPPSIFRLTQQEELPVVSDGYVCGLFLLIQMMYLAFYIVVLARLPAVQDLLERMFSGNPGLTVAVILLASIGIPIRLYLFSAASFSITDLRRKFLRLFPALFVLDEIWALSPFLLTPQIGVGLALGITAALAYVPFGQRTLVLMHKRSSPGPKVAR